MTTTAGHLADVEVWKETAEYLAEQVTDAEPGSMAQVQATTNLILFCRGVVSVAEVDDALNGG